MVKKRLDEVMPECYIDTNLVETLLKQCNLNRGVYEEFSVQHAKGIGHVTANMQHAKAMKDGFALGIVDDDHQKPNYVNLFREIAHSTHLTLRKHSKEKHYLIVVSKAMETLILENAKTAGIDVSKYHFPQKTSDFKGKTKDTDSRNNPEYKNLFKKMSGGGEINLLMNLLDKFVNDRENLSDDALKQMFVDAGY
jgi:hypothetical protein